MKKYYVGSTPKLYAYDYASGVLTDAGTSIVITIRDPKEKIVTEDAAMSKETDGTYYYAGLTLTTAHLEGIWTYQCKETTASMVTIEEGEFEFVKR
ncbi:MAG: hypothetical protein WC372_12030 [Candidatus Neomarinimicrobiota bacterium]|jgi:hypothetical protein